MAENQQQGRQDDRPMGGQQSGQQQGSQSQPNKTGSDQHSGMNR